MSNFNVTRNYRRNNECTANIIKCFRMSAWRNSSNAQDDLVMLVSFSDVIKYKDKNFSSEEDINTCIKSPKHKKFDALDDE